MDGGLERKPPAETDGDRRSEVARAPGAAWSQHYHAGYDQGYRQAVTDLLSSLVKVTEDYLGQQAVPPAELRKVIYSYEYFLERRILKMSPDDVFFVQDGLGI